MLKNTSITLWNCDEADCISRVGLTEPRANMVDSAANELELETRYTIKFRCGAGKSGDRDASATPKIPLTGWFLLKHNQ